MTYADVTTALTGIRTLAEFVTLAAKSKKDLDVAQKAAELNAVILDLQAAMFGVNAQNQDLLRRQHELEQQIAEMENWKATAEKYSLIEVSLDVFFYTNNKDQNTTEPSHWLCTKCYEDHKKSIVQRQKESPTSSSEFYVCPNCKQEFRFSQGWFGNKKV